jgi:hypothetical protein
VVLATELRLRRPASLELRTRYAGDDQLAYEEFVAGLLTGGWAA